RPPWSVDPRARSPDSRPSRPASRSVTSSASCPPGGQCETPGGFGSPGTDKREIIPGMKRLIFAIAISGVAALPLVAQDHQHAADPDKKMADPGTLPAGWKGRLDSGDKTLAGVKAAPMGAGVHFMTGPAGIYYKAADKATGAYEAHATFTQMEPAAHP